MDPRVSFITLAVPDLDAARAFYVDGLGWEAALEVSHNVPTPEEVDAALDVARAAGASYVGEPEEREWGGYTGYFADPAGFRWEVATNPGPIGQAVLP
jgi:catechol 2,3-dioxygenase-like lactoylglutathione lyase family enzyme